MLSCLDNLVLARQSPCCVVLHPTSPIPLYQQLAIHLQREIEAGRWREGTRIPSEHELAEHFRVGRPTVRQATDVLVRQGRLARRRGAGTFVTEPPPAVDLFSLSGTSAAFGEQGVPTDVSIVAPVRRLAPRDVGHPLVGREVYAFSRLTCVRETPVLLEHLELAADVFTGFDQLSLGGRSLAALIREVYGQVPESAYQEFRVTAPSPEDARWLGLEVGAVALSVHRRLSFPWSPSAIVVDMHCRTESYVFSQTLGARNP